MNTSPRIVTMRLDRSLLATALGALLGAASLSACNSARSVGGTPPPGACVTCHGGTDNATGAPPRAIDGQNVGRAVGAHTAHLGTDVRCEDCHKVPAEVGSPGHRTNLDGSPDTDGSRAEVTFGERAQHGGLTPSYDRASFTCSNVYCHQTFRGGAGPAAPMWDGSLQGGACGGCHGAPPSNHRAGLALTDCAACHDSTVTPEGAIKAGGTHLDGTTNAPAGCTGCHGDAARPNGRNRPAPPIDTSGNQASDRVGAHLAHLNASRLRGPIDCAECHLVPADPGHSNGTNDVIFATANDPDGNAPIAKNGGLSPSFNPADGTCSNVYCHGGSLPGGSNKQPRFAGGGAEVGFGGTTPVQTCGVCHGFPPTGNHPPVDTAGAAFTAIAQCNQCHPTTVNAAGELQTGFHINGTLDGGGGHAAGFWNPAVHGPIALGALSSCKVCHGADFGAIVNGSTTPGKSCNSCHANPAAFGHAGFGLHPNWQSECTFCHGDANRAPDLVNGFPDVGSPPVKANLAGPPVVTHKHLVTEGAHPAHYSTANEYSKPLVCTNCHGDPLPGNLDHVVGSVLAIWGPLAKTDGTQPTPVAFTTDWEGTPTCTNYCHGATLAGGTKKSPNWLEGATGTSCGSCHAIPLPYTAAGGFHVQNADCGRCHPGYSDVSVEKATHVDGRPTVVSLTCTSCHGTPGAPNMAPPSDTRGNQGGVRVGAHQGHLTKSNLRSAPLDCVDCHGTKPAPTQIPHANGVINNGFSALAQTGVVAQPAAFDAAWEAAPTCTNYCHGATLVGGTNTTPSWTGPATQAACGACHAIPLPYTAAGGFHVQNTDCGRCHPGYTSSSVAKATHIDGSPTRVSLSCTTCHAYKNPGAAFTPPFVATTGATSTADVRVGAHAKHLTTAISAPLECTDCHNAVGGIPHANGEINVAWASRAGAAATPAGPTIPVGAAVTCANACHGQTLPPASGTNRTPSWTGTLTGCTSCHRTPGEGEHRNGKHDNLACFACHYTVVSGPANTGITNPALHINGTRDVAVNPGLNTTITRNGDGSYTCAGACHKGASETASGW